MCNPYEIISNLNPYADNLVLTVIDGENFGEKAVFSDGKTVYESKEGLFAPGVTGRIPDGNTVGVISVDKARIFCETLGGEKKLVICGGGHVSVPVVRIAAMTGFHVTVIEDRVRFADNIRRTDADEVICEDFSAALERVQGDSDTYFVIVTRGHRYDQVCLEAILKKEHAYIGMIGSRVRVKQVKDAMLEKGFPEELLDGLYSPIGLKIGAETPEEIAVSIMAEIIQVKNQFKKGGYPKEILKAILNEDTKKEPKMLATIISRKGSAPRKTGIKMLIFRDGTTAGTIGGGCAEADICREARHRLAEGDKEPKLCTVDMTGLSAEEEGMVCGGVVEILLEVV